MTKWLQENLNWLLPMLVGAAVTFVVTRHQYGAQRSRISIAWETVALLNKHADSADLEVLHEGEAVSEPHLVTIELRCVGRTTSPRRTSTTMSPGKSPSEKPCP